MTEQELNRRVAIVKLIDFYYTEWGAAKSTKWSAITKGMQHRVCGPESLQGVLYFLAGPAKPVARDEVVKRILEVLN